MSKKTNNQVITVGICDTFFDSYRIIAHKSFINDNQGKPSKHGEVCSRIILSHFDNINFVLAEVLNNNKKGELGHILEALEWMLEWPINIVLLSIGSQSIANCDKLKYIKDQYVQAHIPIVAPYFFNSGEKNLLAISLATVLVKHNNQFHHSTYKTAKKTSKHDNSVLCEFASMQHFKDDEGETHIVQGPSYAAAGMVGILSKNAIHNEIYKNILL